MQRSSSARTFSIVRPAKANSRVHDAVVASFTRIAYTTYILFYFLLTSSREIDSDVRVSVSRQLTVFLEVKTGVSVYS
ncbi:MAG: hypothetical protein J07HQW2_02558 [Haloquadratum walsbyi J07HQW2]|uniref:Uncharacterized protein n=1 Tax=Haloquadratum walsbyi J07HQW2 TaxID=1238425 RepID=U1MZY3_9EURY|nr:MAG: hypothetical protein J07HQW2_02558 [Haloquadratum walsbyi J07HQW2]